MRCIFPGLLLLCILLSSCSASPNPYDLSAQRIQADTEYLCNEIGDRPTGTVKERNACDWLEEQLKGMGFAQQTRTLERVPFQGPFGLISENLIAVCNLGEEEPVLCIMAHYDSVEGSPGARDNASSVAVLLELARYLGPEQADIQGEVRLLFLGSEENGYHGASAYVDGLSQEERARHLAIFNMENSAASPGPGAVLTCFTLGGIAGGEYQTGNYFEPLPNLVTRSLSQAYETIYHGSPLPVFHRGMSDHLIFHQAGIEAANLSWRFLDQHDLPTVPPEYHLSTDIPDTMDFEGSLVTGTCILRAVYLMTVDDH